jgi:hypothetical protein
MATIQLRRATAAQWTAANPVLALGEPGIETDTRKFKVGDGVTAWGSLQYFEGAVGPAGAGVEDGDKGDIVVSDDGATWTIDTGSVTFAKMQSISTDRLVGRDSASSGAPEQLTVGGGLEFTGSGGIQRSALTGDVTASAGSNTTTIANGAVTVSKMANMAANSLMGNNTGSSATAGHLNATAVTAMLNTFTTSTKGLVPASGGNADTFLCADGTFKDPNATELGLQQKMGVVAYFYPDTGGHWETFEAFGESVRLAIMNPASGPGYGSTY